MDGFKNRGKSTGAGFKNRGSVLTGGKFNNRGCTSSTQDAFKNRGQAWFTGGFVNRGSVGLTNFTPLSLFASSEVGAWYDPSDLSTMFQNSNGTTAVAVNDAVGYIADKSGNDYHGIQATAGARPLLKLVEGSNMLLFDGTDDYLIYGGGVAVATGSIIIPFVTGATAFATRGLQVLVSSANSAAANVWFEVGITADGRPYLESNAAGTKHTVYGSSFLANSTKYVLSLIHDGVDYFATIGTVEQNPLTVESLGTVAFIGDVASANNLVVGGTVTSAGLVRPFQGYMQAVIITEQDITA